MTRHTCPRVISLHIGLRYPGPWLGMHRWLLFTTSPREYCLQTTRGVIIRSKERQLQTGSGLPDGLHLPMYLGHSPECSNRGGIKNLCTSSVELCS